MINHLVLYNCEALVLNAMRQNENIIFVDHKCLERGHAHSEVDSLHAAGGNVKRHVSVYVPIDLETVCRMAWKQEVIKCHHNHSQHISQF